MVKRDSTAGQAELVLDHQKKAEREAQNGLRQFDMVRNVVAETLERQQFKLRPSLILAL